MASATDTAKSDPPPPEEGWDAGLDDDDDEEDEPRRPAPAKAAPALPPPAPPRPPSFFRRLALVFLGTLGRRIVAVNLIGLAALMLGLVVFTSPREALIDMRVEALTAQARILAAAITQSASREGALDYDVEAALKVIDALAPPANVRAQLYHKQGRLLGDTRDAEPGPRIDEAPLGAIPAPAPVGWLERLTAPRRSGGLWGPKLELYQETMPSAISRDAEIWTALTRGQTAQATRANSRGQLILSVAAPLTQVKGVMGALVLSTEGGDIDSTVARGWRQTLSVFLLAAAVSGLLAALLAATIARPIEKLAEAAEAGAAGGGRAGRRRRVGIPDYAARGDEIGHLSTALRDMTSALERRMDSVESFAADVAHEIKNPLTSLRSAVETMPSARTDAQRERLLEVIRHDVGRLDRLVTDISNASRLDAELSREEMASFEAAALIEAVLHVTEGAAQKRGVRLARRLPEGPLILRGFEGRLGQVLRNLIDNAISFSPEGGAVTIRAIAEPFGGARLTVEDEGPGIPDENLESVFERFYSERPESEDFGEHSGLGLAISRQIVEAHGGKLWAENIRDPGAGLEAPRKGARFTALLPP